MDAFRIEPDAPDNNTDGRLTLGLKLDAEQADQIGTDPEREFAFALAAVDANDPSTLRWLAATSIALSLTKEG